MQLLLASGDLMLVSALQGIASRHGATFRSVSTPKELPADLPKVEPTVVAIDLTQTPGELTAHVAAWSEAVGPNGTLVAFGPHVQEQRLQAARDAQCDAVATRGQIESLIDRLLREKAT